MKVTRLALGLGLSAVLAASACSSSANSTSSSGSSTIKIGAKWHRLAVPLTTWAGTSVRIVIVATDGGPNSEVEIGIDDIRVERASSG